MKLLWAVLAAASCVFYAGCKPRDCTDMKCNSLFENGQVIIKNFGLTPIDTVIAIKYPKDDTYTPQDTIKRPVYLGNFDTPDNVGVSIGRMSEGNDWKFIVRGQEFWVTHVSTYAKICNECRWGSDNYNEYSYKIDGIPREGQIVLRKK